MDNDFFGWKTKLFLLRTDENYYYAMEAEFRTRMIRL